jgi:hypothetical protein
VVNICKCKPKGLNPDSMGDITCFQFVNWENNCEIYVTISQIGKMF